ncbi:hypothetical protein EV368DRAFT_88642 [Lentinula lateritia]|nr:hypothetical protein EV368DRAFT_88642 [Lentinula lateritia]
MPTALVTSKLPLTLNYVSLLRYNLHHSRTSAANPHFPGPPSRVYTLSGAYIEYNSYYATLLRLLVPVTSTFPPYTLGTSLDLLGTPSRVISLNLSHYKVIPVLGRGSLGSIHIVHNPPVPTCPTLPSTSEEERALELEMERAQERIRKLKERRRAEEEARKRAEEEAARRAAEEREREEAAARAVSARRKEEEAAERRKVAAAAAASRNRTGPSPSEASTSTRRVEVEIPRMINKGRGKQRAEVTGGDPNNGDDDEEDKEKAPCEVVVLGWAGHGEEGGKTKQRATGCAGEPDGPATGRQPVLEGRQDENHARLVAIETRLAMAMADPATPAFSQMASEQPRMLKRRRIVEQSDKDEENEEEEEIEKGKEGAEEEGEDKAPAPKKAKTAASEKGKEREVE